MPPAQRTREPWIRRGGSQRACSSQCRARPSCIRTCTGTPRPAWPVWTRSAGSGSGGAPRQLRALPLGLPGPIGSRRRRARPLLAADSGAPMATRRYSGQDRGVLLSRRSTRNSRRSDTTPSWSSESRHAGRTCSTCSLTGRRPEPRRSCTRSRAGVQRRAVRRHRGAHPGQLPGLRYLLPERVRDRRLQPRLQDDRRGRSWQGNCSARKQALLEPFRFSRYSTGKLHPVSNSPFPWS
jgi:hypothetical protein